MRDPALNHDKVNAEAIREKLKLKHLEVKEKFNKNYPHVEKFLKGKGVDLGKIRQHSAKIIGAGIVTGALLVGSHSQRALPASTELIGTMNDSPDNKSEDPQTTLLKVLGDILPKKTRPLTREEEKLLEKVILSTTGIDARATLEGEHLNTTYGLIGAEQHLMRYPGDTMATHPKIPEHDEGMAPGRGAWGYFAYSKSKLTPDLIEKEKWYSVVQTLYLPDWNARQPYLRDWYKYRKVLIINTLNGKAVVTDIADSGPAAWTGKHFGGSPEVMNYLGGSRYKKGPVILFFVDDPENKVPLGPVDYNKIDTNILAQANL